MNRHLYRCLTVAITFLVSVGGYAQSTVSGKVTSADDGASLPGVNVLLKGTSQGTVTDIDGNYTISIDSDGILVFSSIGYVTQEVPVDNRSTIDLTMEVDVQTLSDEVVVIGYGTSTKKALTGSVEKINPEVFEINPATNAAAALQGRASGVQVLQSTGAPGADVRIRVRGVSSINSGSDPLVVVDGVPGGYNLNDINPNDIESIEVLKDASAGAIYGSRAANGVVLVTTKKGKEGKNVVTVDFQHGFSNPTNELDLLNGTQLLQTMDQAYWNSDPSRQANGEFAPVVAYGRQGFDRSIAEQTNTDWRDLVTQRPQYDQISISTSGGNETTQIYLSGQYRDEDSYIIGGRFRRVNTRLNLNHEVNNWLTVGTNLAGTFTFENQSPNDWLQSARTNSLPIYPVWAPNDPSEYFNGRDSTQIYTNPLYKNDETWRDRQQIRTFTSAYLQLDPLPGLSFRSDLTLSYRNNRGRSYQSRDYLRAGEGSDPNAGGGSIGYSRNQDYNWNIDNVLNYEKSLGEHNVSLMVGSNVQSFFSDGNNLTEEGFPSDYFTLTNSNTEIVQTRISTNITEYRFASFFSRAKYNFRNKYFAEFNYRADASSRFGPENRWGYFPGGAVGWAISEEGFMQNIEAINFLKLRVSYGSVGNAEMGSNFPYLSRLVGWAPYGGSPGFLYRNIGNRAVRWERQVQLNVGLDFNLLNDRISGTVDYFNKDARDLLVNYRIGNYHGYFSTGINVNLGTLNNRGFDFNLTTRNLVGDFSWTTNFNISQAKVTVTELSPFENNIDAGTNRVVEGQPLGAYFLPIWAGVDPVTGHELIYEVDQGDVANRDPYLSDLTGNVIDAELLGDSEFNNHRVIQTDKTPYPDFYGGITNTFSYKGIDLNVLFSFQYGNYIFDAGERNQSYPGTQKNLRASVLNGWTPENPTNTPLLWGPDSRMSGRNTTRFLHDGSFIRLRSVELGYSLPSSIVERIHLSKLRFYVSGQNLLTFTNYPGIDPETYRGDAGRQANLAPGIANFPYPQMRTIITGINVSF